MKKKAKDKVEVQKKQEVEETKSNSDEESCKDDSSNTEQAKENLEPTVEDMKDKLLRMAAEYQNYQKRAQRQIEQASEFASERIIKNLLPVLDNFEHALGKGKDSGDIVSIMQGMQIIYDHMMDTLKTAGMKKIVVDKGCAFDPTRHEALLHVESDDIAANHVVMELAAGYEMNERTIRPAKVSIAKAREEEQIPDDSDSETNNDEKSEE